MIFETMIKMARMTKNCVMRTLPVKYRAKVEAPTAVLLKVRVFWDVTQYPSVTSYRRWRKSS
jgi:hypothetical protein